MGFFNNAFFNLKFISFTECIEIAVLGYIIYYFSLWLSQDRQKNLLGYFYSYCLTFFAAYFMQLHTINLILLIMLPVFLMLFIVLHQELLQKNFIALRSITFNQQSQHTEWLETLLSASLTTINNKQPFYCVIEHKNSLAQFLYCPLPLFTDIQKNVCTILLQSTIIDHTKLVWIASSGQLLGINAEWYSDYDESWISDTIKKQEKWQQNALFYTSKTDAIILALTPEQKTFTIIAQGKLFTHISAQHALTTLKKYLAFDSQKGENIYVAPDQKKSFKQYQS